MARGGFLRVGVPMVTSMVVSTWFLSHILQHRFDAMDERRGRTTSADASAVLANAGAGGATTNKRTVRNKRREPTNNARDDPLHAPTFQEVQAAQKGGSLARNRPERPGEKEEEMDAFLRRVQKKNVLDDYEMKDMPR